MFACLCWQHKKPCRCFVSSTFQFLVTLCGSRRISFEFCLNEHFKARAEAVPSVRRTIVLKLVEKDASRGQKWRQRRVFKLGVMRKATKRHACRPYLLSCRCNSQVQNIGSCKGFRYQHLLTQTVVAFRQIGCSSGFGMELNRRSRQPAPLLLCPGFLLELPASAPRLS